MPRRDVPAGSGMRARHSLAAVASLLVIACPAAGTVTGWRNISSVSGFRGWRAELQRMADEDGRLRTNHFCIVVRMARGGDGADNKAFVHWREGRSLQAYGQSRYAMSPATESGGDYVDLAHDIVAGERDINGSISRVTRAYVSEILNRCRRQGTTVTIIRNTQRERH